MSSTSTSLASSKLYLSRDTDHDRTGHTDESIVLISLSARLAGIGSTDAGTIGYNTAKHRMVRLMRIYANQLAQQTFRLTRCIIPVSTPQ